MSKIQCHIMEDMENATGLSVQSSAKSPATPLVVKDTPPIQQYPLGTLMDWSVAPPVLQLLYSLVIDGLDSDSAAKRERNTSMTTPSDILTSAIEENRPIILVLGQDAWADTNDGDPTLSQALTRLGRDEEGVRGWSGLLGATKVPDEFYDWLADRFQQRVHPPSLEALSELPWSAVFTTSLDPTLPRLLTSRGRQPSVLLTSSESPQVVRSRARPPLYYLFSRAGEHDALATPPTNRGELNMRRIQHASQMLTRALDTATTLGIVVIEGFSSGHDWLRIEDLLGALGNAIPNQILWFGGIPNVQGDQLNDFYDAVETSHIVLESRRLSTLVAELQTQGRLPDFSQPDSEDIGVISLDGGNRIETPPEERLRIEAAASIVDDSWTPSFLPPLGDDTRYSTFRNFHGDNKGARLLTEGIMREFAIKREFEEALLERVLTGISNASRRTMPIIVEGQSGTGKSVALARIVATIRQLKSAAVLYAIDNIPQPSEITRFCEIAEREGAGATLLVCDANRNVDLYHELLSGLRSRGRRVVVLGSQYTTNSNNSSRYIRVTAPSELSDRERQDLATLLESYIGVKPDPTKLDDNNILAFLYRVLPASRPRIGAGLGAEAMAYEQAIRERGNRPQIRRPVSPIHQQLIDLGIIEKFGVVFEESQADLAENGDDASSRIIDLVMAAGSLNCPVPINLLLRAVTSSSEGVDYTQFADLFRDLDLFRWESNDPGGSDLAVKPRLTLEAQLICRRRFGGADTEANRIVDLIGSVRNGLDSEHELRFVLSLLRQVGPDGPRGNHYQNSYIKIAKSLTELRTRYGVTDARLMLQESTFRRNAVRRITLDDDSHLQLLEDARDAVQTALNGIADGSIRTARRTKQNLLVEHSAIYGFLARYRTDHDSAPEEIWSSYQAARTTIQQAVSAADNYYPHDIGLWTPADLLERFDKTQLTDVQKAEIVADIYSALDQVEPEALPPTQWERFQSRRQSVGEILGNHKLSQDAYEKLEAGNSTAGYFLRARSYAPLLDRDEVEVTSRDDIAGAKQAADYLEARFETIEQDARCLSLLLECRWISEMHRQPLRGDRQPLPIGDVNLTFLRIVRALNQISREYTPYRTRYLEAVLMWLTENYQYAQDVFRQLSDETDYEHRGRVIKRHVISCEDGTPRRFEGRVDTNRGGGNERIRIQGLDQTIPIRSSDFPREEIKYGRSISGFAIAFNFIGPIADPIIRR